jgi:hypothetical protein
MFHQIKQWIVNTLLRSLNEAYNAALAIQGKGRCLIWG